MKISLRPKIEIYAKVIRADGTVEDLGCIASTENKTVEVGSKLKKLLKKLGGK